MLNSTTLDGLQETFDLLDKSIKKLNNLNTERSNMEFIKEGWKFILDDMNKIAIYCENKEITPTEILLAINSYEKRLNTIKEYARDEIVKREYNRINNL